MMPVWLIDVITGGFILAGGFGTAWWIRKRACRCCHGSGVVFGSECTCGRISYESGHEPYCGAWWCPRGCKAVATKEEAMAIWARHT